jgi:phosphatidyl-myo-inositol dimannoside synthase
MGGMQRVSMQLLEVLQQRKDVKVEPIILHANWKGIGWSTSLFLMSLLMRLPAIIRRQQADLVVFSSMVTSSLIPLIKRRCPVPMITINHGLDVTQSNAIYQWYIRKVFKALDATISVSSATREECLARGMDPSKAFVIPNGLPDSKPNLATNKREIREELENVLGIPASKPMILTVGRQVKRKGHAWFIEHVLPLIETETVFVLVGDGPENTALKELSRKKWGISEVILTGKIEDQLLDACYTAADLFVMPNIPVAGDMEGFGVVMIEANLRGLPVVASRLEGIIDVVEDGKNGYLVPALNPKETAQKINQILSDSRLFDPHAVCQYVTQKFSWSTVVEAYIACFQTVVGQEQVRRT